MKRLTKVKELLDKLDIGYTLSVSKSNAKLIWTIDGTLYEINQTALNSTISASNNLTKKNSVNQTYICNKIQKLYDKMNK